MTDPVRYAALLRGINVGGHKPVKMEQLDRIFNSLKFKDVKTLIASGNVLFSAIGKDEAKLTSDIEKGLSKGLGFEVPVMVRALKDIETLAKKDPFKENPAGPEVKNYVAFLSEVPKKGFKIPMAPKGELWEILGVKGREVYVTTRKKKDGHNGFPNDFIEKGLGVTATTRNWNTVLKLIEKG